MSELDKEELKGNPGKYLLPTDDNDLNAMAKQSNIMVHTPVKQTRKIETKVDQLDEEDDESEEDRPDNIEDTKDPFGQQSAQRLE